MATTSLVGPPVVAVPGRLDRRLRLGPFPSGRDAIKFLVYAAVGAVFAPTPYPFLAAPFIAAGLLVTLYRPDGQPIDARLAVLGRYLARRSRPGGAVKPSRAPRVPADSLRLHDGRHVAVIRTGGVPLDFLPPDELARRFDLYRELLRSVGREVKILATSAPIHAASIVPWTEDPPPAEREALRGYRELVVLLARRRAVRQVYLGVVSPTARAGAGAELAVTVAGLAERLSALGLRPEVLRGSKLRAAAARLSWTLAGAVA
jgi:hypothetical protein